MSFSEFFRTAFRSITKARDNGKVLYTVVATYTNVFYMRLWGVYVQGRAVGGRESGGKGHCPAPHAALYDITDAHANIPDSTRNDWKGAGGLLFEGIE